MEELFFQVLKNLVVHGRVSSTDGKVFRWIHTAILATAVGSEIVNSWFDPVEMVSILTAVCGNNDFPGVEETCGRW